MPTNDTPSRVPPEVVDCEQGTPEWERIRAGRITASAFDRVLPRGKGAETYALELVSERLTGKPLPNFTSKQTDWGNEHEGAARAMVMLELGVPVDQVGFLIRGDIPTVGASPDGLIGDDTMLEIKCPYTSKMHLATALSGAVPKEYVAQVQGQLWVADRDKAVFASYDPRMPAGLQLVTVDVERDPKLFPKIDEALRWFAGHVDELETRIRERING